MKIYIKISYKKFNTACSRLSISQTRAQTPFTAQVLHTAERGRPVSRVPQPHKTRFIYDRRPRRLEAHFRFTDLPGELPSRARVCQPVINVNDSINSSRNPDVTARHQKGLSVPVMMLSCTPLTM